MAVPPTAEMFERLLAFVECKALMTAAELGVADELAGGPRSIDEVAAAVDVDAATLLRVVRALASTGVFVEVTPSVFANTPLSETLRDDVPGSMRGWARMLGRQAFAPMGELLRSCQSGQPSCAAVHGEEVWDYLATRPEENDLFNAAMASSALLRAHRILGRDWSTAHRVVDVGGNTGELLAAVLDANPHLTGVVFDQPHVVSGAAKVLADAGVLDRCEIVGGSFFDAVPAGADVYMLAAILHDWDDDRAGAILRTVRAAMPENGRVLIVELVLPPSSEPSVARLMDLVMLTFAGGRERDASEWRALIESAGLTANEIRTGSQVSIIEAMPA